jgi:hypothetical protein
MKNLPVWSDENPYEVGDHVLTHKKRVGEVIGLQDDFCKVKFIDGDTGFVEHQFLEEATGIDAAKDKKAARDRSQHS